jgi:type II secretory pathway predicted ATPase ExeA
LEEVRLLLGLNLPSQPTFALILLGDEYLLAQLQLRNHRALCSRLSAHHLLSPWTLEEIQTYLTTGLQAVGIHRTKVFEPAAVDLLVRATAGVPRSVCLLARAAWLEAARAEAREIGAPTMQLAMEQVPGLLGLTRPNS